MCYISAQPFSNTSLHFPTLPNTSRPPTLNKQDYHLEFVSLSDPGRVRAINEDSATVDSEYAVAMVADGMGGHRAGDVASRMALDIVGKRLQEKLLHFRTGTSQAMPMQFAEQIVGEANTAIHAAARQQANCSGMGTTLALAIFHGEQVTLLHVGDSRIYRLRNGQLQLLTRDDSMLHDQVDLGLIAAEDTGDSHNRHLVTQALGASEHVTVHRQEETLCAGDFFLLCTDGLSDLVEERDIELIMNSLKTSLPLTAHHLIQLANDNGGYDNITVALVRVLGDVSARQPAGWLRRLLNRFTKARR